MEKPETSSAPARAEASPEESLRLLCDLADALDAQARRADRLSTGGNPELVQAITADAARLKRRADQLRRTLGPPPRPEGLPAEVERSRQRASARREDPGDAADAARTVAVDLKMAGQGPEEVTQRLAEVVGEERAVAIVEEVFEPAG